MITRCWNKHRKCARWLPNTFLSWKHKIQRWRRNTSWWIGATRCKPWRFKSWANNAERVEHGLPNSSVTTFRCEACAEHKRSRIDSENWEPSWSTCSSTKSTTKPSLQPVQYRVKTNESGRGQGRTVWIAWDGPQNAMQSMPIILEWRHRLLHMRASLKKKQWPIEVSLNTYWTFFQFQNTSSRREDLTATDMGNFQETENIIWPITWKRDA